MALVREREVAAANVSCPRHCSCSGEGARRFFSACWSFNISQFNGRCGWVMGIARRSPITTAMSLLLWPWTSMPWFLVRWLPFDLPCPELRLTPCRTGLGSGFGRLHYPSVMPPPPPHPWRHCTAAGCARMLLGSAGVGTIHVNRWLRDGRPRSYYVYHFDQGACGPSDLKSRAAAGSRLN
jgi:hypothetical protein